MGCGVVWCVIWLTSYHGFARGVLSTGGREIRGTGGIVFIGVYA